jgi:hypothetical protein
MIIIAALIVGVIFGYAVACLMVAAKKGDK